MTNLTNPIFHDEAKARAHFEAIRWPGGPACPHCGTVGEATRVNGKSHRPGMFMCNACREPFSVTVGTVMERSHIPLHKWALAFHLMAASKKGVSAHQLHRTLGITYKSAWFLAHRVREAMAPDTSTPIGGAGKVVEADEMFLSKSRKTKTKGGPRYRKNIAVLSLVERGGPTRSFPLKGEPSRDEIIPNLWEHVHPESTLHTDGAQFYKFNRAAAEHETVDHSKEYVREGRKGKVHTNTAEGYFSVFKRGMVGTYQHCGEQHLHRYLNEFDFGQSNRVALGIGDTERAERAIKGAEGRRLTYRQAGGSQPEIPPWA